jgi:hypothetical protein
MAGTAREAVRQIGGFGTKQPAKGSAEMKAKMAKLRAMKGGSFRLN